MLIQMVPFTDFNYAKAYSRRRKKHLLWLKGLSTCSNHIKSSDFKSTFKFPL